MLHALKSEVFIWGGGGGGGLGPLFLYFVDRPCLVTDNLTPGERATLISLRQRTDIVTKPADKGGAVVVWDRNLYKQEAESQLSDSTFYERLDRDFTVDYNKTVCEMVKEAITKGELPGISRQSCRGKSSYI